MKCWTDKNRDVLGDKDPEVLGTKDEKYGEPMAKRHVNTRRGPA